MPPRHAHPKTLKPTFKLGELRVRHASRPLAALDGDREPAYAFLPKLHDPKRRMRTYSVLLRSERALDTCTRTCLPHRETHIRCSTS